MLVVHGVCCTGQYDLLVTHASNHVGDKIRAVTAILEDRLAEDLPSHLHHSILAEQGERVGDCVLGNAMSLEADFLHCGDLGRGLIGEVLLWVPCHGLGLTGLLDKKVRDGGGGTSGFLGLGANNHRGLGGENRRGGGDARHG